jgi:hypothetical protein
MQKSIGEEVIVKIRTWFCELALCAVSLTTPSLAQVVEKKGSFESVDLFDLPELGAIIVGGDKELRIEAIVPAEGRPKSHAGVDLQEGDVVLLFNRKRVKTIADIKEAYEGAAVADTIKMGIRRGQEMFLVSFVKADPKNLPKRELKIIGGSGPEGKPAPGQSFSFKASGKMGEGVAPVLELGIIIGGVGKQVKVIDKLQIPGTALEGVDFQKDDVLQTLNGKAITSTEQFSTEFGKITVGDKVELKYRRGDKPMTAAFAKPQARGKIMMKTREN